MPRQKILLDSCSYLRLARSVHPLLGQEFGSRVRYCLYICQELEKELKRTPKLKLKFPWVDGTEYVDNRTVPLILTPAQRSDAKLALTFLRGHAQSKALGVSHADTWALAIAYVLQIQVATDDGDMLILASDSGIRTLKTLELVKLMLDHGHIIYEQVVQVVEYWRYDNDLPGGFRKDFPKLFPGQDLCLE